MRFVIFESIALVILLFLAKLGMSHPFPGDPLRLWFRTLTIVAVLPVGAIPILFTDYRRAFPEQTLKNQSPSGIAFSLHLRHDERVLWPHHPRESSWFDMARLF